MRSLKLVLCLVSMMGVACEDTVLGPTVPLSQEFVLSPGTSAAIEQASLTIRFNGVSSDSRCPADAVCVQAGNAIVRITAISEGRARDYELHTNTAPTVRHGDLTIALLQLSPYPFSSRPVQPDEYRAALRVTR